MHRGIAEIGRLCVPRGPQSSRSLFALLSNGLRLEVRLGFFWADFGLFLEKFRSLGVVGGSFGRTSSGFVNRPGLIPGSLCAFGGKPLC